MKFIKKLWLENKNIDYISRMYLISDYMQNIRLVILQNKLNFRGIFITDILNLKLNSVENENKILNKSNKYNKSNSFPDFEKELSDIKSIIRKKKIEKIKYKINKIIIYTNIKYLFDLKNSQNNIQEIFAFISNYIAIYKKSIQELVEGQREVTQNKNFTFDDGETVQNKLDKFEEKIKEHLTNIGGKFKSQK